MIYQQTTWTYTCTPIPTIAKSPVECDTCNLLGDGNTCRPGGDVVLNVKVERHAYDIKDNKTL